MPTRFDIRGQQVGARRQELAEFDECRAEFFESQPDALRRCERSGSVSLAQVGSERAESLQSARVVQPPQPVASQNFGDLPVAAEV